MDKQRMSREINLLELFWQILFGWRQIICFGLIFAGLFAGLKYAKDMKAYQSAQKISVESQEDELSREEMQQVEDARDLLTRIDQYQQYLKSSALMQIDHYKKPMVELQYYIDTDYTFNYTQESENDYSKDLMTLYYNYMTSGEMSQKVIKDAKLSLDQADLSELLSVVQADNSIFFKITCTETSKMDAIAKSVKSQLSEKEAEFQKVGTHKLMLLGESQNVIVDNGLAERKNTIGNNITTLNTQLNTLKTNMSDQQIKLLDSEQEEMEGIQKLMERPRLSVIYLIFGAVLGILFVCAWKAFQMVSTVKIQNPEEVCRLFDVRLLGEVATQHKGRRFLSAVDGKLYAVKERRKKKLPKEQQIKMASANIALTCRKNGIDCVYMTGSEYENMDTSVLELLKAELAARNVQVKEGGNIFYDVESLERGTELGNMLFIEQVNVSIYDEIANEFNLAKEQGSHILGVVVFT